MKSIQIALEQQYATSENLSKIAEICPKAKIAVFSISARHPFVRKVRGLLRRIFPYFLYKQLEIVIDSYAEQQALTWKTPPGISSDVKTVLLFPPGVVSNIAEQLISACDPKWVHSIKTGLQGMPYLKPGTELTNSRGVHSRRIAEFTIGLIFSIAKNILQHSFQSRKKTWKTLPSQRIDGSRLGIIGLGSIGYEIARLGKAVGMEIWATRQKPEKPEFVDRLLSPNELFVLLSECDYIVLSIPLTPNTNNIIGSEELKQMKKTAALINISNGGLVDEDALYNTLKHSKIRCACIDVFKDEKPIPKNSRFYYLKNLLITSYSAYYSDDSLHQVMELFFDKLKRFSRDEAVMSVSESHCASGKG